MRSSLQPTRRHASRARSGARSAIAATSMPGRGRHLREEHRAELAGADQPDAHRPSRVQALAQQPMQIHRATSLFPRAVSWPIATPGQGEWRWRDRRGGVAQAAGRPVARDGAGRRDRDPAGRLAGAARAASAGRGGLHAGRNGRCPRRAQDRRDAASRRWCCRCCGPDCPSIT